MCETCCRAFRDSPTRLRQVTIKNARGISMLSEEVLNRLFCSLASQAPGPILEVGPYIGGSTTALCGGARRSGARIVSIEAGGSHPEHPTLPSRDIVRDLRGSASPLERRDNGDAHRGFRSGPDRTLPRAEGAAIRAGATACSSMPTVDVASDSVPVSAPARRRGVAASLTTTPPKVHWTNKPGFVHSSTTWFAKAPTIEYGVLRVWDVVWPLQRPRRQVRCLSGSANRS